MNLLCFILGIFFTQILVPILDGIASWFLTWIEAKKVKQSEIINTANIKMRQAATSADENPPMRPIGFRVPDEEEENKDEV